MNRKTSFLMVAAILTLFSFPVQAAETELRDWLWYFATNDVGLTQDQMHRRQLFLIDMLDSSGGQAHGINGLAWSILGGGQEAIVSALELKTYLNAVERSIRLNSSCRDVSEVASQYLKQKESMAVAAYVNKNGAPIKFCITKSSGSEEFDTKVLKMLKNGFPREGSTALKKPPYDLSEAQLLFEFYLHEKEFEFAVLPTGSYGGPIYTHEITPR